MLGLRAPAGGSETPQEPPDVPPVSVKGTERLGWDQPATTVEELGLLHYVAYIDGQTRVPLAGASCNQEPGPSGFECSARLPALSRGRHALALAAVAHFGDAELEGPRSTPLSVVVSGVTAPRSATSSLTTEQSGQDRVEYAFATRDGVRLAVEVYASGLDDPTSLAFAPDGRLFVAERRGQIRVVRKGTVFAQPALILGDALDAGEVGSFVSLALHPAFERTHLIYLLYTAQTPGTVARYRLARFREVGGLLAERAVLLDGIPVGPRLHGATIRFGPDRRLYLGVEDLTPSVAQDLGSMNGKILRLNDDGTVPRDNPLSSSVFSYGHAAPQGLAWNPETGDLWETEREPNGRDRLNLVTANTDYGWPDGRRQLLKSNGQVQLALGSFVAPAGASFYDGTLIPEFRNNLFFASLGSNSLYRVKFDTANPRRVVALETFLEDRFGRIGDIVAGPDGALYFSTANRAIGASGPGDDRILRIVPAR